MSLIPVAEYVRMSTDKQQYSITNQQITIRDFAARRGFEVIRSYADLGKSGVTLKGRGGLRRLLRDAVTRATGCRAVLVYDVSRWGRFPDVDESAHYEFICRNNDLPVLYCAEPFDNDFSQSSLLLKAVKRVMAAEFSRQLGNRVFESKKVLAEMGYRVGGSAPFGLRRAIFDPRTKKVNVLKFGDRRKTEGRVTIVPGPLTEIAWVQKIFEMFLNEKMGCHAIAERLNREGVLHGSRQWIAATVRNLLTNPIYAGKSLWGRTSQRMRSRKISVDPENWVALPHAFEPLVSAATFKKAQKEFAHRAQQGWNKQKIVDCVRSVLAKRGRITERLIERTRGMPSSRTVRHYFGSYSDLYEVLGYRMELRRRKAASSKRTSSGICGRLIDDLLQQFQLHIAIGRRSASRCSLLIDGDMEVSIVICPTVRDKARLTRWRMSSNPAEPKCITLVCLLNVTNTEISQMFLVPRLDIGCTTHRLREGDPSLRSGIRLRGVEDLYTAARSLASSHFVKV
jgi:DNA invertase Pin-like site-specific DNA recombinase